MRITCYSDKSYPDTCIQTLSLRKYMWHWILWHLFPDIQCSVTIESRHLFPWHLFPQGIQTPVSRHLFPKGIETRVSWHLFPKGNKTPVSWHLIPKGIKTPVSWHLFPGIISRYLFPDTCFTRNKLDTCFPTFVSPKKILFPDSCFPHFLLKKMLVWSMTKRV